MATAHAYTAQVPEHVLWWRDRPAIDAHFAALPANDLRLRFGQPMTPAQVTDYLERAQSDGAVAFGIFERDGTLAAFAHFGTGAGVLELGLSVLPEYRRRGYAMQLLERARVYARAHGCRSLLMHSVADNHAIRELARRAGMTVETVDGETDSTIRLLDATPADYWREVLMEQAGFVHRFMRWPRA